MACLTRPSRSTPATAGTRAATELRKPAGGCGEGERGWEAEGGGGMGSGAQ